MCLQVSLILLPPPIGLGSALDLSQAVFAVLSDGTSLEHVCVIRLKHSLPGSNSIAL